MKKKIKNPWDNNEHTNTDNKYENGKKRIEKRIKKKITNEKERKNITKIAINKYKRNNAPTEKKRTLNKVYGNNNMKIATISPDNTTNYYNLTDLANNLFKHDIDIAAIQETHDKRNTTTKVGNYYIYKSTAKEKKTKENGKNIGGRSRRGPLPLS